jgi:hypothetical protein
MSKSIDGKIPFIHLDGLVRLKTDTSVSFFGQQTD